MDTSLKAFIVRMPKVDLHLHLEGSLRPETLRELARAKDREESEVNAWVMARERDGYRYRDFRDFLSTFTWGALLLEKPADYALATTRLVEWLAEQNVKYAEVTLSAGVVLWKKQPLDAVFEAVSRAAREAQAPCGIRVNWIFDAIRHFGIEHARQVLEWATRYRSQGVVAFGIGGDEERGPADLFVNLYREARDAGLHVTAHAGETVGPRSVRDAVRLLGAERIGHGLTAEQDSEVLSLLRERKIPLEVCLSSNVSTGVIPRVEAHPLRKLMEAGVVVTLNSDDPALFGTSLEREFLLATEGFRLTRDEVLALTGNAIRAAFLPEEERQQLLGGLESAARW